jgi:hypothetical protein
VPQGASFANQALTTIAQPVKNAAKKLCQEKDLAQIGREAAAFAPLTASSGRAQRFFLLGVARRLECAAIMGDWPR